MIVKPVVCRLSFSWTLLTWRCCKHKNCASAWGKDMGQINVPRETFAERNGMYFDEI
jgi:hypothetical protein